MFKLALQPGADDPEDRALSRYRLLFELSACAGGIPGIPVTLHNLSGTGMLFQTTGVVNLGERITLELPSAGVVEAEVVWRSDEFYGAKFDEELDERFVRKVVAESRVIFPRFGSHHPSIADRSALQEAEQGGRSSDPRVEIMMSPARRLQAIISLSLILWTVIGAGAYAVTH